MKKILLGLIIGAVILIPGVTIAEGYLPTAKPIYEYEENQGNPKNYNGTIYVFDDKDNKCYVAAGYKQDPAISCVKR